MIPPTVVSSIDKRHSYETALAYQEAGALLRFVTGGYLPETRAELARRLPGLGARLGKRADPRLDPARVVSMPLVELVGSAAARFLGEAGHDAIQWRNRIFDRRCANLLDGAGSVHGFECTALKTFEKAKARGMRTLFDAPTVHHTAWHRIIEEELLPVAPKVGRLILARLERTRQRKSDELALADQILVPSEWCASTFRSQLPNPARIAIAGYGTRVREGEPKRPEGKPRFLSLASGLGLTKGTHLLLEGFAALRNDAELWLVGPVLPDLIPFLATYGESVRLFGWLDPAQVQVLFDQCHAFVLPSLCEGSSLAVMEAMGQGLPVVVTERCGSPVSDGVEGILVQPNSAEAITQALVRLRDSELRLNMGERSKARARKQTWASYREHVRRAVGDETVTATEVRAS